MDWLPKDPDETRRYTVDWSEIAPDTILSFTLTRTAGTVTIGTTGIEDDDRSIYALIRGGVDGETATFLHRITTTLGQVIERTISLRVIASADSLSPVTGFTKGDLVSMALEELGIASYVFDVDAGENVSALRKLDAMMAEFQGSCPTLTYSQPATSGTSTAADASGIDEAIVNAVVANLAVRLAPSYGKSPATETRRAAADGRGRILSIYAKRVEYDLPPSFPRGAARRDGFNIQTGA